MVQIVVLALVCIGIGSIINAIYNKGVDDGQDDGEETQD